MRYSSTFIYLNNTTIQRGLPRGIPRGFKGGLKGGFKELRQQKKHLVLHTVYKCALRIPSNAYLIPRTFRTVIPPPFFAIFGQNNLCLFVPEVFKNRCPPSGLASRVLLGGKTSSAGSRRIWKRALNLKLHLSQSLRLLPN